MDERLRCGRPESIGVHMYWIGFDTYRAVSDWLDGYTKFVHINMNMAYRNFACLISAHARDHINLCYPDLYKFYYENQDMLMMTDTEILQVKKDARRMLDDFPGTE